MNPYKLFQSFKRNTVGTDYAVGDIHGCKDLFEKLLETIQFNTTTDRIFSTGDFVDRGEQSEAMLSYLDQPWFYAVRGNHEQMAIGVAEGRHNLANYIKNGGEWFFQLTEEKRNAIAERFKQLPLAIEVDTAVGKVGLVHAEPGEDWALLRQTCENLHTLSNTVKKHFVEKLLWSRVRTEKLITHPVAQVTYVVVGHTSIADIASLGNVVYVDTGAVYGLKLSAINLNDPSKTFSVSA